MCRITRLIVVSAIIGATVAHLGLHSQVGSGVAAGVKQLALFLAIALAACGIIFLALDHDLGEDMLLDAAVTGRYYVPERVDQLIIHRRFLFCFHLLFTGR